MFFSCRKNFNKILNVFAFFAFCVSAVSWAEYQSSEVIVKYRKDKIRIKSNMNPLYDDAGVQNIKYYSGMLKDFEQLFLKEGVSVESAIEKLMQSELVEYAQPNYLLYLPEIQSGDEQPPPELPGIPCIPGFEIPGCDPNIPFPCLIPGVPFPPGCSDDPTKPGPTPERPKVKEPPSEVNPPVEDPDLNKLYGLTKLQAKEAWEIHKGSKNLVVAVIDTGVDYNHADLSFNMWRNPKPTKDDLVGFDFIHNDGLPFDDQGHGTHTSGTVGAVGGNGVAISGVSQRVSIMALKFITSKGTGTTADAIRAIDYAVQNGAKVLSNSWGGRGEDDNKALSDAIERARQANVLFVAAAGNDGTNNDTMPTYPASYDHDNILAVAATDANDGLAFFSNYGKKTTDVAAPGVNIYSTIPGDKYNSFSGTSMACPHAAGAAALLWSKNPTWDYKKVKEVLMKTVDVLPALQNKTVTDGRINVLRALRSTE